MLFWFRKVHSGASGEVSAEKWESWDFFAHNSVATTDLRSNADLSLVHLKCAKFL